MLSFKIFFEVEIQKAALKYLTPAIELKNRFIQQFPQYNEKKINQLIRQTHEQELDDAITNIFKQNPNMSDAEIAKYMEPNYDRRSSVFRRVSKVLLPLRATPESKPEQSKPFKPKLIYTPSFNPAYVPFNPYRARTPGYESLPSPDFGHTTGGGRRIRYKAYG